MTLPANPPPPFERSARRDWRVWLCLLAGAAFAGFATIASREEACRASGSCSPLITALVTFIGLAFAAFGALALWRNGSRGSRFDPLTGELTWWQHRRAGDPGLCGSIHPREIARIVIARQSDSADEVHLIGADGLARAHFNAEVLPWQAEAWARQLAQAWPHIAVEIRD